MNFRWLLNGSLNANHLAAGYLTVWIIQGGYACWTVWQWMRVKRESNASAAADSAIHDRY